MMRQVLYTKLFIVMGIAWIFECVHHLVHSDHHHCGHAGLELIFRLIGCLNLLRGSLIFFIFVCKDSILDKVSSKYLLIYLDRVCISIHYIVILLYPLNWTHCRHSGLLSSPWCDSSNYKL